ncbi:MAG: hypothetical protein ACRDQB_12525 [Thermocrispum sp.]
MNQPTDSPWHVSLTGSVSALGAAAREYGRVYLDAGLALEAYKPARLQLDAGRVTVTIDGFDSQLHPHRSSIYQIGDVLRDSEHRLFKLYETAALSYAGGATWAINQVLQGRRPPRVELTGRGDGSFVLDHYDCPDLTGFPVAASLSAAYEEMLRCAAAADLAEDLAGRRHLPDHESSQMHDATGIARGLPDAACVYGGRAAQGLHYVLKQATGRTTGGLDQGGGLR